MSGTNTLVLVVRCGPASGGSEAGRDAWQSQAMLRGYELLDRCMGLFSERVDLDADSKLIKRLIMGRKRAARLLDQEEPPDAELSSEIDAEEKPK